jgi:hypothetical protein
MPVQPTTVELRPAEAAGAVHEGVRARRRELVPGGQLAVLANARDGSARSLHNDERRPRLVA